MSGERQLGGRCVDACMRRVRPRLRHIDEYRFAVTQFGCYPLPIARRGLARINDTKGISEVAVGVCENAQHCHVDGHVADATWCCASGTQVALRSSAPIASSTATRVSTEPDMALSLIPARSRPRR